jgi:small-conductance mechanosensitive channel
VVKNWTHGNTMGRVAVKVRVAYDSDAEKVRDILLACGAQHPQVLRIPPATVFLMGLGDIGIDFELRCMLANVEQSLSVRTDLQMEILRRFRDAGIKIPFRSTTPVRRDRCRPRHRRLQRRAPERPAATTTRTRPSILSSATKRVDIAQAVA